MSSSPSDSLYVIVSSSNISSSPEVVSSSGMVNGAPNLFVNTSLNRDRDRLKNFSQDNQITPWPRMT